MADDLNDVGGLLASIKIDTGDADRKIELVDRMMKGAATTAETAAASFDLLGEAARRVNAAIDATHLEAMSAALDTQEYNAAAAGMTALADAAARESKAAA